MVLDTRKNCVRIPLSYDSSVLDTYTVFIYCKVIMVFHKVQIEFRLGTYLAH